MAEAARDGNFKTTLLGVSSIDNSTPVKVKTNPETGALFTESSIDTDPLIADALNRIYADYGVAVSVKNKAKALNKFGKKTGVSTSFETIMSFQGSETRLTYPSTNAINSIISTSAADTSKTYVIEGHTIDLSGNLTFVSQDATTNASSGQTRAALTTPMRDVTRAYLKPSGVFNSPQTVQAGIISFYDNTNGDNGSGVPTTASAVSLRLLAGETQSQKAATSVSSTDFWLIKALSIAVEDASPSANFVTFRMVIRDVANGGVFRPLGRDYVAYPDGPQPGRVPQDPIRVVPRNHDWEILAKTDTGTADVFAEAEGNLAN